MNRRQFLVSLVAAFAIAPSAIAQSKSPTPPSADTLVLRHGPIALFVACDAGGGNEVAARLQSIAENRNFPIQVREVPWCRHLEVLENYADHDAQLTAAASLAQAAKCVRKVCPECQIVFVGYGAGSRVVLAAAEQLGADSVDRIVLLAPAVASHYDLRPALRASGGGIDSFYSCEDRALDVLERWCGTADGQDDATAGRVGFQLPGGKKDGAGYGRLRQYAWTLELSGSGGHLRWSNPIFLCRLMRSLQQPPASPPVVTTVDVKTR